MIMPTRSREVMALGFSPFTQHQHRSIMPYFEVENYQVFKFASAGLESASAIIHATGEDNTVRIVFLKPNAKMPKSTEDTIYYRDTEFPIVMDLFRHERPIHLNTTGVFFIFTEQEGIGDHEIERDRSTRKVPEPPAELIDPTLSAADADAAR